LPILGLPIGSESFFQLLKGILERAKGSRREEAGKGLTKARESHQVTNPIPDVRREAWGSGRLHHYLLHVLKGSERYERNAALVSPCNVLLGNGTK
jgi:hypothetical protein